MGKSVKKVEDLDVKIFGDGADLKSIAELSKNTIISGYTTNPSLMRRAGVTDYKSFAHDALKLIGDRPISFEIFSDNFHEMERQAREIASWHDNIYVKIPITNTKGITSYGLIRDLTEDGIKVNVTAITTTGQVDEACHALEGGAPAYISVFAGRIADTGRDPVPYMRLALDFASRCPNVEIIWASPRELLNIFQADAIGCDIITVSSDILAKLPLVGKNLLDFSLETVSMFHDDALKAGYVL